MLIIVNMSRQVFSVVCRLLELLDYVYTRQRFPIHECFQIHHIQDIRIHKAFTLQNVSDSWVSGYNVSTLSSGFKSFWFHDETG